MLSTMSSSNETTKMAASESENVEEFYENYILIDIGAYLAHKKFQGQEEIEKVVQRAKDAGVQKIVVLSMSAISSKEALRLTNLFPDYLYCAVGIHPHEARQWTDDSYETLATMAANEECVAIGECGLDYNRLFSPKSTQKVAFASQVQLACELKKPLVLHEREAHADVISVLNEYRGELPGGVVHCFTGGEEEAKAYLDLGFFIAINGYLCKDKSSNGVRALLQNGLLPLDRLLIESDAPYMFPNTQAARFPDGVKNCFTERSLRYLNRYCTFQRNEPCCLPALVEMIAGLLGRSPEDVALATAYNSLKLFSLANR